MPAPTLLVSGTGDTGGVVMFIFCGVFQIMGGTPKAGEDLRSKTSGELARAVLLVSA